MTFHVVDTGYRLLNDFKPTPAGLSRNGRLTMCTFDWTRFAGQEAHDDRYQEVSYGEAIGSSRRDLILAVSDSSTPTI